MAALSKFEKDWYKEIELHPELEKELSNLLSYASETEANDASDIITAIELLMFDCEYDNRRVPAWLAKLAKFYGVL